MQLKDNKTREKRVIYMKLSAASKRAQNYCAGNGEWHCGFTYTPVQGLGREVGVHRRDPSSILKCNNKYYVWYTKSCGPHFGEEVTDNYCKLFPWDYADIYYATSVDGINWKEEGCAVPRGGKGEYDERTVCTPEAMEYNGKYYLVYQAIPQCEYTGFNEKVAMAVADSPDGPFIKTNRNILSPMKDGNWFEGIAENNYNDDFFGGRTHDPCLFHYNEKFYLYYKCGAHHQNYKLGGYDTRWGVATADDILGPYEHSEYNPISNSGHETLLWKYQGGMAALLNRDGPEKNTIQYAKDGINFEIMTHTENTPQAGAPYRCDNTDLSPLEGLRWGMCHCDERISEWNYLLRFDIDQRSNAYVLSMSYPINE